MNEATPGALLGVGKEAEVRAYGYLVAKLYNAGASKHRPLREAAIQAFAETLGPPVPSVHEVRQIDGRWAVVMDRVAGVSFAEAVRRDAQTLPRYLERADTSTLSGAYGRAACVGAPPRSDPAGRLRQRLAANIQAAPGVAAGDRDRLLMQLREMPDGNRLCHGDFHGRNVLGDLRHPLIIDWLDATRGDPLADVCRSCVLMRHSEPSLAVSYVEAY